MIKMTIMISKMNQSENSKANKVSLIFVNSFLIIGITTLIFTLLYLLFNLDTSDKIIYSCIPGFTFGLVSVILYGFLYNNKTRKKRSLHISITNPIRF